MAMALGDGGAPEIAHRLDAGGIGQNGIASVAITGCDCRPNGVPRKSKPAAPEDRKRELKLTLEGRVRVHRTA